MFNFISKQLHKQFDLNNLVNPGLSLPAFEQPHSVSYFEPLIPHMHMSPTHAYSF